MTTATTGPEAEAAPPPLPFHARAADDVAAGFGIDVEHGLTEAEAARQRAIYGPNLLQTQRRKSGWAIAAHQFHSLIVWLLVAAAALSFAFGEWAEGAAIAVVIVLNALLGFATEMRAMRSMEALRRIAHVTTRVRRDGALREVPARALVPGDVVMIEGGDVISADLRLVEAANLGCDESTLTGESVPVHKSSQPVAATAPLAERASMAFKGTAVTRGAGAGIVTATGMDTELGRISSLIQEVEEEETPLERRLDRLSGQLVWLTLVVAAIIAVIGTMNGHPLLLMIETAIALAVAAVPEGLPMVSTLALARGMWRMARRNALIESLPAVETLGATTIICADKTGTLTENRMEVTRLIDRLGPVAVVSGGDGGAAFIREGQPGASDGDRSLADMLRIGALCNNASDGVGDPTELALLSVAARAGIDRAALLDAMPRVREEPFDGTTKMMATVHRRECGCSVAVKGAPEPVIEAARRVDTADGDRELTASARAEWRARADDMARHGLRVLGLARKDVADPAELPYEGLTLLGLVGMHDPPRGDVGDAIDGCRRAGIRVVMVTGDHGLTARAIATEIGLADESADWEGGDVLDRVQAASEDEQRRLLRTPIFARVTPEQKLRLVEFYQRQGHIVAMTGDGVNDAPALKKADIGVAMGLRGTDVAREAADMVLSDDSFPTIVAAVEQGRVIFANIRKFVLYLLSCNLSEILVVGLATLSGLPLPLLPLQILFLNLVTDVFPAFALGAGEGEHDSMRRPPRPPEEPVLMRRHWTLIVLHGFSITASTLGALVISTIWFGLGKDEAVTVTFLTLAFAQLWHVFNMRGESSGPLRNEVTRNPYVWTALALCFVLLLAAVHAPVLSDVLRTVPPDARGWAVIAGMSLVPLIAGQVLMLLRGKKG